MRLIDSIEAWGLESRASLPDSELQRLGTFWSAIADAPVGNRPVAFLTDRDIEDAVGLFAWTDKAELLDLLDDVREWYFARPAVADDQSVGFSAAISAPTMAHAPVDASVALPPDELGPAWSDGTSHPATEQRNPFVPHLDAQGRQDIGARPESDAEFEARLAEPFEPAAKLDHEKDPSLIVVPGVEALAAPRPIPEPLPQPIPQPVSSRAQEPWDTPSVSEPAVAPSPMPADIPLDPSEPVAPPADEPILNGTGPAPLMLDAGDGVFPLAWDDPVLASHSGSELFGAAADGDGDGVDAAIGGDQGPQLAAVPDAPLPDAQPEPFDETFAGNPEIDPFADNPVFAPSPADSGFNGSGRQPSSGAPVSAVITPMGALHGGSGSPVAREAAVPPAGGNQASVTPMGAPRFAPGTDAAARAGVPLPVAQQVAYDGHETHVGEYLPGLQPVSLSPTGPQPVLTEFAAPDPHRYAEASLSQPVPDDPDDSGQDWRNGDWRDDTPLFDPHSSGAAPEDIPGMMAAMPEPLEAGSAHAGEAASGDLRLLQLGALLLVALVLLGVVIAIGFDGTGESPTTSTTDGLEVDTEGTSGTLAGIGAVSSTEAEATPRPTTTPVAIAATEPAVDLAVDPALVPLISLGEREAVLRDGKLYLEGPVPNRDWMDTIVAKANAVIGAENVVNNYVIHPDAPAPTAGVIRIDTDVSFDSGSTEISGDFESTLQLGVSLLNLNPQVTMLIEGHTDNAGDPAANTRLSLGRATAVLEWLVTRGGIETSRLEARGFGSEQPIADNDSAEGRARNRRIEVKVFGLLDG